MSFFRLRTSILFLAGLIGISALWILAAELTRPPLAYFPADIQEAGAFDSAQTAANSAAHIAWIRGDLWAAAAVTEAATLVFTPRNSQLGVASQAKIENAEKTALEAAKLSPHDARVWLMLADLQSRRTKPGPNAAEALKLSYYTGPNEFALAPVRLLVAGRLTEDEELQGLVQSEIQRIILKRPDLKPAIVAAYQAAVPQSRQIFEAALKDADPNFLTTLTTAPRRP